jgi:hypothetical protein
MVHCPKCGYEMPKGKVQLRIWVSKDVERKFNEYAEDYNTKQTALISLLEKARRLTELEPGRIAIEPAGKS